MKSSEEVIGKLKSVISDIEESKQEDSITLTYKSALEPVSYTHLTLPTTPYV